jgi:phosphoglycolate phosphatase
VVFDLDGTLVDTGADIAAAVNRTRADYGLGPLPQDEIVALTGLGATELVRGAIDAAVDLREATDRYVAHYAERPAEHAEAYADAPQALAELHARGVPLAVCTNKRAALARAVLEATGLYPSIDVVVAADDVASHKPDPKHLLAALRSVGGDPARSLYVGDDDVDIQTARAGGVRCAIVAWGRAADSCCTASPSYLPSSARLASMSIPCRRARLPPRILRLAWSVSCG